MLSKMIALGFCALASLNTVSAQVVQPEKHSITVSGSAEREVVPDEIYMTIVLKERYDGRDKIEIAAQERQMIAIFKEVGVCDTCYALSDADQAYTKVKAFKKDAITTKTYEVKVTTASLASVVLEKLGEMKITGASIDRTDYSKKKQLKKELYMEAVRAAKEKATYVLEAINETIGKPVSINVEDENIGYPMYKRTYVANTSMEATADPQTPTEFKKIKFTYRVNAEFTIK